MSSAFAANLVTAALAKILIQAGFERAQNSSTSILADIFVRYLELLACTASKHANHQGRTTGNFEDVARVLDDFSVDPTALTEFCRTWAVHINPESVGGNHGNPSSPSHTGAPANSHRHGKAEDHDEPAAFPINIDELLEASALEAKHKSLLPRKARGSASPSKEGHGSPTRAPFADSHPHRSGSEHQGGGRQFTRRRKRKAAYGCVVSFDETHMTAEDLDIVDLQPPDHQPTLQVFDSTPSAYVESLKQALSSVSAGAAKANGKITSKALLKQMLPLLQHSRVATAGNHLFSVERGLLDEMVGAELAKLPGLLEGQRPRMQRAPDNLDQIATTKRRKIPRNAAETDKSGAEPKLKLKLSLSTARLSPPPAAAVPAGFPVSTFQLHPKSPASGHPPEDIVNCICDQPQVDHGEFMIACDKCGVWYHGPCVGVPTEADQSSENWYCVRCQPRR